MTDVRLVWDDTTMSADLRLDGAALATDDGLETAVIISLFTDRRARPDDPLPTDPSAGDPGGDAADRRGWWGDALPPVTAGEKKKGDRIGSRLWLLSREKQLPAVLVRAREYAEEALAWLLEDGIATRIEIEAEFVRPGVIGLLVRIHRPASGRVDFRFSGSWEAQAAHPASAGSG